MKTRVFDCYKLSIDQSHYYVWADRVDLETAQAYTKEALMRGEDAFFAETD